ncbi:MAG TPA: hypothetical protein VIJ85_05625 [Rhizomicrobium sp.]
MRILIAGLLGAIAMFVWTSVAHLATPLATIGISQISDEAAALPALDNSVGVQPGLYFFPWVDPKDPDMPAKTATLQKAHGHGLLIYSPAGVNIETSMVPMLIKEFIKQFVQALIAAAIVSMMIGATFLMRWGAVTLIGVSTGIATNVSYWNWYHFPLNYTLSQITIEVVSAMVAGLAIAWWLGRRAT